MARKKKKAEFSKVIWIVAAVINAVVIGFTCVMVWRTNSTDALAYLIPSVAAEVSVGTHAYYRKAEVENRIKLKKTYQVPLESEDFTAKGDYS